MNTIHFVLERQPLRPTAGNSPSFTVSEIGVGVRDGMAFRLHSDELYRSQDCWFYLRLEYPGRRRADSSDDFDQVITNGDEYWLVRRSLGKSPLVLTQPVIEALSQELSAWCAKLS